MKTTTLFLSIALAVGGPSFAQDDYPSKPIRLITPAAQGGTTDILARVFGARMSEIFKQQVLVDNRASASGVIAGDITAKAEPDGYTLLLAYHQHTVNAALNPKLPYHPVNSFTPITHLTTAGFMLVVHPSQPPKTLAEFVEWTRKHPGPLNFGSAGIGSGGHMAGELYKMITGVKAQHIPYKGTGPAIIDLIAGQYHFNFAGLAGALVQTRSGKLRGLAVTTPRRIKSLPDIPAVAEVLPGFEVVGWYGLAAPANLPKPILAKIHGETVAYVKSPEFVKRASADGAEAVTNDPETFRQFMLADVRKWAEVVITVGAIHGGTKHNNFRVER